jgi:hypothetical protein
MTEFLSGAHHAQDMVKQGSNLFTAVPAVRWSLDQR